MQESLETLYYVHISSNNTVDQPIKILQETYLKHFQVKLLTTAWHYCQSARFKNSSISYGKAC